MKHQVHKFAKEYRTIVETFGTPVYAASETDLDEQYKKLHTALVQRYPNSRIAYSFKTNYLSRVCDMWNKRGAAAEVVSGAEYTLARNIGFPGNEIIFNGPLKTEDELRVALIEGATIHVDNREEYRRLEQLVQSAGLRDVSIGVRLNSSAIADRLRGQYRKPGLFERFGFNIESGDAATFCTEVARAKGPIRICGFHTHIATDIRDDAMYGNAAHLIAAFAARMARENDIHVLYIDMGGGLPADAGSDVEISTAEAYVHAIASAVEANLPDRPRIILEPGRYLVSRGFELISRVVSVKQSRGEQIVTVDATEAMLPSYQPMPRPLRVLEAKDGGAVATVFVGASCMAIEVFGRYQLPVLSEGDVIVFENVGAYSLSRASQFIYPRPAIAWIDTAGSVSVARHAETATDLTRLDVR